MVINETGLKLGRVRQLSFFLLQITNFTISEQECRTHTPQSFHENSLFFSFRTHRVDDLTVAGSNQAELQKLHVYFKHIREEQCSNSLT